MHPVCPPSEFTWPSLWSCYHLYCKVDMYLMHNKSAYKMCDIPKLAKHCKKSAVKHSRINKTITSNSIVARYTKILAKQN